MTTISILFAAVFTLIAINVAAKKLDVLMIAVDDLRPQMECVDLPGAVRPTMYTPNICKLAKSSLVLERSQVAMSTCSPSRTALLTGRHTSTTYVKSRRSSMKRYLYVCLTQRYIAMRSTGTSGISIHTFETLARLETGAQSQDTSKTSTDIGRGAWVRRDHVPSKGSEDLQATHRKDIPSWVCLWAGSCKLSDLHWS